MKRLILFVIAALLLFALVATASAYEQDHEVLFDAEAAEDVESADADEDVEEESTLDSEDNIATLAATTPKQQITVSTTTAAAQQQQPQQLDKARFIYELSYFLIALGLITLVVLIFTIQACIPQPVGEQLAAEAAAKPVRKICYCHNSSPC